MGDVDYRNTNLGQGRAEGELAATQPIFSSTTAGAPVGIESVSQAQTVKLCVEAPYYFLIIYKYKAALKIWQK